MELLWNCVGHYDIYSSGLQSESDDDYGDLKPSSRADVHFFAHLAWNNFSSCCQDSDDDNKVNDDDDRALDGGDGDDDNANDDDDDGDDYDEEDDDDNGHGEYPKIGK